ncbi:MAG: hypothetical protein K5888_02260, partial [Lachnospiraceae bacterium]|nr:hypothetical protein [Lachnospiraceae bacterium]
MSADYSRRGIKQKQRSLHMQVPKFIKKIIHYALLAAIIGLIGVAGIGCSLAFGIFKGVIDT